MEGFTGILCSPFTGTKPKDRLVMQIKKYGALCLFIGMISCGEYQYAEHNIPIDEPFTQRAVRQAETLDRRTSQFREEKSYPFYLGGEARFHVQVYYQNRDPLKVVVRIEDGQWKQEEATYYLTNEKVFYIHSHGVLQEDSLESEIYFERKIYYLDGEVGRAVERRGQTPELLKQADYIPFSTAVIKPKYTDWYQYMLYENYLRSVKGKGKFTYKLQGVEESPEGQHFLVLEGEDGVKARFKIMESGTEYRALEQRLQIYEGEKVEVDYIEQEQQGTVEYIFNEISKR
ncbi:hypothetical protein [Algivirga pacifica]|uniref:Outer membrane lipoprotein-sorting protein n=1 Tax=Algivirga pacifica TaxID=1162670 RepID=A0ABP9DE72_9BACT